MIKKACVICNQEPPVHQKNLRVSSKLLLCYLLSLKPRTKDQYNQNLYLTSRNSKEEKIEYLKKITSGLELRTPLDMPTSMHQTRSSYMLLVI